jgi:hypothetical protein
MKLPRLAIATPVVLTLLGCASTKSPYDDARQAADVRGDNSTAAMIKGSLRVTSKIPDDLKTMPTVYGRVPAECERIAAEIVRLDEILGTEFDVPLDLEGRGLGRRSAEYGRDFAIGTVLGYIAPVIEIGRFFNDSSEKERDLAEAVDRGTRRRAYLRGLAEAFECDEIPMARTTPTPKNSKDKRDEAQMTSPVSPDPRPQ